MKQFFTHLFPFRVNHIENTDDIVRFVKFRISYAKATGYLHNQYFNIVQYFSSQHTYTELFETFSRRPYKHQVVIKETRPVLTIALRGNVGISCQQHPVPSQIRAGQCVLVLLPEKNITLWMPRGHARILFIAFRHGWFHEQVKTYKEIRLLQKRMNMKGLRQLTYSTAPLSFAMGRTLARLIYLKPGESNEELPPEHRPADSNSPIREEADHLISQLLSEYNTLLQKEKAHLYSRIDKIRSHIQKHLREQKPLPDIPSIASRFGFSPRNLQYYIKEATGFTPTQFINHLKMHEAMRLLTETRLQIQEIADILGYQTLAGFRKEFRKQYQQSPGYFRQHNT